MSKQIIAIAGGTSPGLGRAIVTAILQEGSNTPIVLSRESSSIPDWLREAEVEVRKVDYLDSDSCTKALEGVHTIISTLLCKDGTWFTSQKNLLDAGLKNGVKRYVPSEWGIGAEATHAVQMLASEQLPIREALLEAVKTHPGFEFAAFSPGQFTNYLGYGSENPQANGMNHVLFWNVKDLQADIPVKEDGTFPLLTMTTIEDTGRFVAAACTLPSGQWKTEMQMAGDTLTMNRVIALIEKVRAGKVIVTKRTGKQLLEEASHIVPNSEESVLGIFFLELMATFAEGKQGWSVMKPELNELFPKIKPTTVEEYLMKYWA